MIYFLLDVYYFIISSCDDFRPVKAMLSNSYQLGQESYSAKRKKGNWNNILYICFFFHSTPHDCRTVADQGSSASLCSPPVNGNMDLWKSAQLWGTMRSVGNRGNCSCDFSITPDLLRSVHPTTWAATLGSHCWLFLYWVYSQSSLSAASYWLFEASLQGGSSPIRNPGDALDGPRKAHQASPAGDGPWTQQPMGLWGGRWWALEAAGGDDIKISMFVSLEHLQGMDVVYGLRSWQSSLGLLSPVAVPPAYWRDWSPSSRSHPLATLW